MGIRDIAYKINDLSKGYEIKGLQNFRQRVSGGTRSYKIFSESSIIENDDYAYAFHDGGRKELQFNIGGEEGFFRYGVAFSLQPSQSLPDPVAILKPRIERFNRFVRENQTFFPGYLMWYWQNDSRSKDMRVQEIGEELITNETFIFIGNKIDKPTEKFNDGDYEKILKSFDHLYLLYRYVQSGNEWIARICWNDQGWRKPSGRSGKSDNKDTYEYKTGFGHEEWLFDTSKVVNGYHYGFLQPIQAHREKYTGQVFDIHLYSIDGSTGEKWWLGKINNAWVVDGDESKKAYGKYDGKGYLQEMVQQLIYVDAEADAFKKTPSEGFLNVKFRPDDLDLLDEPQRIAEDDETISGKYYTNFITFDKRPKMAVPYSTQFDFKGGTIPSKKFKTKMTYGELSVEVDLEHNRMISNSWEQLKKQYGKENVRVEVPAGRGTKVDLVVKDRELVVFYEFKTAYSFIECVRNALGQLMEYSYYPDKKNADKLVIVSDKPITKDGQRYMERIRKEFNLPIYYQQYNPVSEQLEPEQF